MELFRAVRPAELASLQRLGRFMNPVGVESKYSALNLLDAGLFAIMAQSSFRDGPYVIVRTSIDEGLVPAHCRVVVDGGIDTVALPDALLTSLVGVTIFGG